MPALEFPVYGIAYPLENLLGGARRVDAMRPTASPRQECTPLAQLALDLVGVKLVLPRHNLLRSNVEQQGNVGTRKQASQQTHRPRT
jgi:hypothetical protein